MTAARRHTAIFVAALIVGAGFYWADRLVDGPVLLAWKGAGVALLALWAALSARNRDGWLIAGVLAFGAVGDVLIDAIGLIAGALAFLAGHILAVVLYARNRRSAGITVGTIIMLGTVIVAWSLTGDAGVAVYALGLGAMAGAAWESRFPRDRVALGALLFVASDLLIFARLGPLHGAVLPDLLVWPLYFAGQALIAHGVVTMLARETRQTKSGVLFA